MDSQTEELETLTAILQTELTLIPATHGVHMCISMYTHISFTLTHAHTHTQGHMRAGRLC